MVVDAKVCPTCNLTAAQVRSPPKRLFRRHTFAPSVCADWEYCCHRSHAGDPAWGRCRECGTEFLIAESVFDTWCDSCTKHGCF
jgi:hypothetical protein